MNSLLDKEAKEKIEKPDFSTRAGRLFLAKYLEDKFYNILEHDSHSETPVFKWVSPDFIDNFSRHIVENPNKRFLVGIFGESASGKTTICNTIKKTIEELNLPVEVLSADNYFRDISALIKMHGNFDKLLESGYDVDSPNNFELELLYHDLSMLASGKDVKIPQYLVNGSGVVVPEAIQKYSKKIIVVEGMASMYGDVKDLFDVRIFVDIDPELQKKWFLYRAVNFRNQNEENALKQLEYVRNASKKYIVPLKQYSDIIINGGSSLDYFCQIIEYIYKTTNNYSM
ncbi:hypothetical protein IKQ26_00365 [bacterium]|nr:hypothetical protein [bacterium]